MELEGLSIKVAMDSSGVKRGADEGARAMEGFSRSVDSSASELTNASTRASDSMEGLEYSMEQATQSGTALDTAIDGVSSSQSTLANSNANASTTLDQYSVDAGEAAQASEKVAASQDKVSVSATKATGSVKETSLSMVQVASSAMALYGAYDAIGDAQLALDRANLQVEKSTKAADVAQKNYNDALAKYGEGALETQLAAETLRLKQEEIKLNTDAAANAQENYNEKIIMAGMTAIPAVISGIDGLSKAWKGLQALDMAASLGSLNKVLVAHRAAIISAGAGLAAVAVIYGAFTTTSEETRIGLSILAGGLVAAAAAQWVWNAATAFGLGLTGAGLALVAIAGVAAATVYAASSKYGAKIEEDAGVKAGGVEGYGNEMTAKMMMEKGWAWDPIKSTWYNANQGRAAEADYSTNSATNYGNTNIFYIDGAKDVDKVADAIAEKARRGGI